MTINTITYRREQGIPLVYQAGSGWRALGAVLLLLLIAISVLASGPSEYEVALEIERESLRQEITWLREQIELQGACEAARPAPVLTRMEG